MLSPELYIWPSFTFENFQLKLFQDYCQRILGQIELWIINFLYTSSPYKEISFWIEDTSDFGNSFEVCDVEWLLFSS